LIALDVVTLFRRCALQAAALPYVAEKHVQRMTQCTAKLVIVGLKYGPSRGTFHGSLDVRHQAARVYEHPACGGRLAQCSPSPYAYAAAGQHADAVHAAGVEVALDAVIHVEGNVRDKAECLIGRRFTDTLRCVVTCIGTSDMAARRYRDGWHVRRARIGHGE